MWWNVEEVFGSEEVRTLHASLLILGDLLVAELSAGSSVM